MGCNCSGNDKTQCGAPVDVRCTDTNGCAFVPWGDRAFGEVYEGINACTAALFVATWPARLEIVKPGEPAEAEA